MDGEGLPSSEWMWQFFGLRNIQISLQLSFFRTAELSSFGSASTSIAQEGIAVVLIVRPETPLLRQIFGKLLVKGLPDILWQDGEELECASNY